MEPPKVRSEIARIDLGGPPMAVPFAAGPMVRIRFPPAESPVRTSLSGANPIDGVADFANAISPFRIGPTDRPEPPPLGGGAIGSVAPMPVSGGARRASISQIEPPRRATGARRGRRGARTYSGVKLAEAFAIPDLDREVKWHCKYARQNGIHVSPTFMIDGLVQADMSSGDPVADWVSRLQKH